MEEFQSTRGKESLPSISEKTEQQLKVPLTPFRRNRSRVFYASSTNPSCSSDTISDLQNDSLHNTLKIKVSGPSNSLIKKNKLRSSSLPSCIIHEVEEDVLSSSDEATGNYCSEESSPVSSLTGSWRGSDRSSSNGSLRGSPSQRSQDSGYSDSGESNTGCQNEGENSPMQPQVRHITRVYFGDYSRTPTTCDRSNNTDEAELSTHSVPKNSYNTASRILKLGRRKANSTYSVYSKNINSPKTPTSLEKIYESNYSVKSLSPTTDSDDVTETELEHKSLCQVSSSTPIAKYSNKKLSKSILRALFNDQRLCQEYKRKNSPSDTEKTSSRNYRKLSQGRRDQRKSKSSEKLLDEISASVSRRQEPLKAKRRWSSSDVDRCHSSQDQIFFPLSADASITQEYARTRIYNNNNGSYGRSDDSTPCHDSQPFRIAENLRNDSLEQWLVELRGLCESECMNTLQSKSLHTDSSAPLQSEFTTHATLAGIQSKAHTVSAEFALLCQRLEHLQLEKVPALVRSLVSHIQTFIQSHCSGNSSLDSECSKSKASLTHQTKVVDQICNRLIEICSESIILPSDPKDVNKSDDSKLRVRKSPSKFERQIVKDGEINRELIREFVQIVTALGHAFTKLVDILLSQGLRSLVNIIEEESDVRTVENAITEVTGLGVNGGHVCQLVGRVGGIRALLGVCIEYRFQSIRPLALRALATVCCVAEGIAYFEKEGGVDVIADILCDNNFTEEERSEAAGVLAQITSPWVEDNHSLPCLRGHLNQLIKALTDLAESTTSSEVFLLTSAALANLTFLDVSCIDALLSSSTHEVLLTAAKTEENLSVFTKDQIATILSNMSSASLAAKEVVEAGGIEVLISLLKTEPSISLRIAEISATERVQQKSAIALSRICTDPAAANQVLSCGGAARLVALCKNEKERNQSDAVLVACLAALRKIASSCGHEELRQVDASELVEPRLLDSFLIYSSQQESYV